MIGQGVHSFGTILGGKLSVIQPKSGYRFSIDSVLLARLVRAREGARILDLGAGCGVVALIIAQRLRPREIVALEIDSAMAELIHRNASANGYSNISTICGDLRKTRISGLEPGGFDVVVANPPFRATRSGRHSPNPDRRLAREEVQGTLEDFVKAAARYAKFGGTVEMVMVASRGAELISLLRSSALEPKRIRLIHPRLGMPASVMLVEARRGGRVGVLLEPPLIIYSGRGRYTPEAKRLLGMDSTRARGGVRADPRSTQA